ncbi:MAG: tRNA (adenosine(37)-N6)-threonylcarbamoyltransferase complex dimerization subunit type 1 TsaB [Gammaproteobacteria bacterium]
MKLLAIDTATEACSVALNLDGAIVERYTIEPRSHASQLLPMVDALLAEAAISLTALDAIAFDRGPGSFTGIRIGTSVVQGLAFGADLPVVPISSLDTLAQGMVAQVQCPQLLAVLDARMDEVYWARYIKETDRFVRQGEEQLARPADVRLAAGQWAVAGTGWGAYQDILQQNSAIDWQATFAEALPRAADLAVLAARRWQEQGGVEPMQALPVYLRNDVAKKKAQQH